MHMKKIVLFLCSVILFIGVLRGQPQNISLIQPSSVICLPSSQQFYLIAGGMFHCSNPSGYAVQSIPFDPPVAFNTGTIYNFMFDDRYSSLFDISFPFCFFNTPYDSLVVGSNGLVSFNKQYANQYCPWSFINNCPSISLPLNSIFGVYQDLDISICGNVRYSIVGSAPYRKFIVNMHDVCYFSCTSLQSTHQIVLYETYNFIDVFVKDKPLCSTWNQGAAIVGIQDSSGVKGIAAPGRNTNPAWTATNEAWRFIPCISNSFEYEWYENGVFISDSSAIQIAPTATSTYILKVTFESCSGDTVTLSDTCVVVIQDVNQQISPSYSEICRGDTIDLSAPQGFDYFWSLSAGNTQVVSVSPQTNTTYSVILTDQYGCNINATATVIVFPDVNITVTPETLWSNQDSATSYQWLECDNNFNPLLSQVFQELIPPYYGGFAVEIVYNGCIDTSDCVVYSSLENFIHRQLVTLFPNPSSGMFSLKLNSELSEESVDVAVLNSDGRIVFRKMVVVNEEIFVPNLAQGVYLVQIHWQNRTFQTKLLIIPD